MNTNSESALNEVHAVLQKFQDGYTQHDVEALGEFMKLFVPDEEMEVIGTGAAVPGEGEWCLGRDPVRKLVEGDWKSWGDVSLDVEGAKIHVLGGAAWLATSGTASQAFESEEGCKYYLDYLRQVFEENIDAEKKLQAIVQEGTSTLLGAREGETFIWSLRFTAVLIRHKRRWRLHQIQFSFPATRSLEMCLAKTRGQKVRGKDC